MEKENAPIENVLQEGASPAETAAATVLEQPNPIETILGFMQRDFEFGSLSFTPLSVVGGVALLIFLVLLNRVLKRFLRNRVFPRAGLTPGVSAAMSTLAGYIVLVLGILIILPVI